MKLSAAISDTDLLIHLFETGTLHIIEMLFEKIYVPRQVMRELQRKNKNVSFFVRRNNNQGNVYVNTENSEYDQFDKTARIKAREVAAYIDNGEAHCVGYSYAMQIPIVISNNKAEFEIMEQYIIPLNFPRLIFVLELKGLISSDEAVDLYTQINENMDYPSSRLYKDWVIEMREKIEDPKWKAALEL